MSLQPGSRIGNYEILSTLGAGGMGEVFRARDTRLGREVAIKALPEEFSQDKERLARFEREAKLLAALNHSNIATLYGLEESGGKPFLVMELVEGETLADRIGQGPIPIDEAILLFVQIAEGLEAAHEKGIIHRDLKPANIKITPEGSVRVLDFGLAKIFEDTPVSGELSHSPTVTREGTRMGTIMGTVAYMSPEQTRGKRLDRRSDMWSFGCCLFEAITGSKAFDGETVTDIFAAIVRGEPDWSRLPKDLPAPIELLLRRCLSKDLAHRLRDAGDARIELEEALKHPAKATRPDSTPSFRIALAVGLGLLLLALGVGIGTWLPRSVDSAMPVKRLEVNLPEGLALADLEDVVVALSPDGELLVFIARAPTGRDQVYLRSLVDGSTVPVPGTEGASSPFFSPDGAWIGFAAGQFLKKVAVSGGSPSLICEAVVDFGASWGDDDTIVFADNSDGLFRVPASGGESRRFTRERFRWPVFLPGGRTVLAEFNGSIFAVSLDTGEAKRLVDRGATPRYVSSGHLIYEYERTLYAVAFDLETLDVRGTVTPLGDSVRKMVVGPAQYDVTADGSLIYLPGVASSTTEKSLVWVERDGSFEPVTSTRRAFNSPRLSPDGRRIAVAIAEGPSSADVWVHDIGRDALRRVTLGANSYAPLWNPNGQLSYSTRQNDVWYLMQANGDGSGDPVKLIENGDMVLAGDSWSPDGRTLLYSVPTQDRGWDERLFLVENGSSSDFVSSPAYDAEAAFSLDGKWVAYASQESGLTELYVQALSEPGKRWQISDQYGRDPIWTSHGKEIVFRSGRRMLSVAVRMEPDFEASVPQVLFEGPFELETGGWRNYDVTKDGQRFVMIQSDEGPLDRFVFVLNWFEELKRVVPTKN